MRPPKTDSIFEIRIKSTMIEKKTIKTDTRNKRTNKKKCRWSSAQVLPAIIHTQYYIPQHYTHYKPAIWRYYPVGNVTQLLRGPTL